MKKLSLAIVMAAVLFLSCNKEKEKTSFDVESVSKNPDEVGKGGESTIKLSEKTPLMTEDLDDILESEGVDQVKNFGNYAELGSLLGDDEELARVASSDAELVNEYKQIGLAYVDGFLKIVNDGADFTSARVAEEEFDITSDHGIYYWDFSAEDWAKENKTVDYIEIKFPATTVDSTNKNNNASFFMYAYEEDADGQLLEVDASLKVDGSEVMGVKLDASYGSDKNITSADIKYVLSPYTIEYKLKDEGNTFEMSQYLKEKGDILLGFSVDVEFTNASQEEVSLVNGALQYIDVIAVASVDVEAVTVEDDEDIDFDDVIKVVFVEAGSDKLIGNLVYKEDGDEAEFVVEYPDGTEETVAELVEPMLDEIEELADELEEEFDDDEDEVF